MYFVNFRTESEKQNSTKTEKTGWRNFMEHFDWLNSNFPGKTEIKTNLLIGSFSFVFGEEKLVKWKRCNSLPEIQKKADLLEQQNGDCISSSQM